MFFQVSCWAAERKDPSEVSDFPAVFFYLVMKHNIKHKKKPNVNKLSRAINYFWRRMEAPVRRWPMVSPSSCPVCLARAQLEPSFLSCSMATLWQPPIVSATTWLCVHFSPYICNLSKKSVIKLCKLGRHLWLSMVIDGQEQWACLFLSTLLMNHRWSASPNLVYLCCVFHLDICIYVFLFGYLFFWCWLVRFGERQGLITQPLHLWHNFPTTYSNATKTHKC